MTILTLTQAKSKMHVYYFILKSKINIQIKTTTLTNCHSNIHNHTPNFSTNNVASSKDCLSCVRHDILPCLQAFHNSDGLKITPPINEVPKKSNNYNV